MYVHLFPVEDETLLRWRDTFLLFYLLLDLRYLQSFIISLDIVDDVPRLMTLLSGSISSSI